MTRTLILIRHAKSAWDDPLLADHDRPLNDRGWQAAARVGAWLARQGLVPEAALVSSALRAQQTWARLAERLPSPPLPETVPRLYHAGPDVMLAALQGARGGCVAMVGHNPGIAWFARQLLSRPPGHPRFADYPTGATLVARFDVPDWSAVSFGTGAAVDFVVPRALPEVG